jgi:hypothetical protein
LISKALRSSTIQVPARGTDWLLMVTDGDRRVPNGYRAERKANLII